MLSVLEIIRNLIPLKAGTERSGLAIDVGAHVGEFSKILIDSELFEGVIAFEPNPVNAEVLADLAANEHKLTVVRCAVGATQGESDFYCDENTSTGSLLSYREDYVTDGLTRKWSVPVVALDTYRSSVECNGRKISLIKIDTQGHDLAVIQGASQILTADRPLVITELIYVPLYSDQATPDKITNQMHEYGYQLYTLFNIHATVEGKMAYTDALFIPDELDVPQSQEFVQLDNHSSLRSQIKTLEVVCHERLSVINILDAEVKRLHALNLKPQSFLKRLISWVR